MLLSLSWCLLFELGATAFVSSAGVIGPEVACRASIPLSYCFRQWLAICLCLVHGEVAVNARVRLCDVEMYDGVSCVLVPRPLQLFVQAVCSVGCSDAVLLGATRVGDFVLVCVLEESRDEFSYGRAVSQWSDATVVRF